MRFAERHLPATSEWNGTKLFSRENGKRLITPMFLVVLTLGTTDLLFALDSIPAIYGLTQDPYLVFTANVFALMGLRQLYFLIGGLLQRLIYLSYGLAVLLGFIGVKLVLHAMHENELPFINGGEPVEWAPDIPIWLSLVVIVGTLAVTAVVSLLVSRNMSQAEIEARTISLGESEDELSPRGIPGPAGAGWTGVSTRRPTLSVLDLVPVRSDQASRRRGGGHPVPGPGGRRARLPPLLAGRAPQHAGGGRDEPAGADRPGGRRDPRHPGRAPAG